MSAFKTRFGSSKSYHNLTKVIVIIGLKDKIKYLIK